jgi:hypothetical protein
VPQNRRTLAALIAVVLVAGVAGEVVPAAAAGPKARAKKPTAAALKLKAEVSAAIASGEPLRICRAAIELGKRGDHARAGLLVGACTDPSLAEDAALADLARQTRIAVSKAATAGDWSKIELVIKTAGISATVDAFPEIPLASGTWRLPPGTYTITAGEASQELVLRDGIRSLVMLQPPPAASALQRQKTVDFTSGTPMDAPVAGPPKVEHGSLLPARYRRGLDAKPPKK